MLGISASVHTVSALEACMYGQPAMPILMLGTVSLQHLAPLAWGTEYAWTNATVQLGLDALYASLSLLQADPVLKILSFNAAHKFSMLLPTQAMPVSDHDLPI